MRRTDISKSHPGTAQLMSEAHCNTVWLGRPRLSPRAGGREAGRAQVPEAPGGDHRPRVDRVGCSRADVRLARARAVGATREPGT